MLAAAVAWSPSRRSTNSATALSPTVRATVGSSAFGSVYQDIANLPEDIARAWLEPLAGTPESARQFQRLMTSLHARDLLAVEPALARLQVPTLIVWGTGDRAFRLKWAYWLRDTIPGATGVVEIDGARLFFPDERAGELTAALRRHWDAHP